MQYEIISFHILPLVWLCNSRWRIILIQCNIVCNIITYAAACKGISTSTAYSTCESAEDFTVFLTGKFLRVYLRPEGAPALCDDPGELGQPPGIHLKPLQWVIPASTPGPIIEVIFIEASLWANNTFLFSRFIWSSPSPHRHLTHLDCQKSIVHFWKLFYTFQDVEKLDIYSVPMSLCVKISSLLHLIKDLYFCVVSNDAVLFVCYSRSTCSIPCHCSILGQSQNIKKVIKFFCHIQIPNLN